jgi:hypothetical protein
MNKTIAIAAGISAAAALAYTGLWLHGASRMEQTVADWKEEAESNGLTITHKELEVGGFPFALTAEIHDLSLRNEAEGARVEAAPIRLRTTLWNPNQIQFDFTVIRSRSTRACRASRQRSMSARAQVRSCWRMAGGTTA